ncbi:MAG: hypothetical protein J6Y96_00435 [Mycoplasma sp.]|nr:hypothetical protein [Mycoplasma sp.]
MEREHKNFNYLKEKLTILMSKYSIYSFRVKNHYLTNKKVDLKQYRLYLEYINKILNVMDADNAEIIRKLYILRCDWTSLGYSRSCYYDHRRKAVLNFFDYYEDVYDVL